MKDSKFAPLILTTVLALQGCAGYDQWAEDTNKKISSGYTELLLGKQSVDYDESVPKDAAINIAYRIGEGVGIPGRASSAFYNKLMGDVTFSRSCKQSLSFQVGLINKDNALIQTEAVFIPSYDGGIKALVNKDVLTDPTKQRSSQVAKLLVKDFKCLPEIQSNAQAYPSGAAAATGFPPVGAAMNATSSASPLQPNTKLLSAKAKSALEQALSCNGRNADWPAAEAALKQAGWKFEQGIDPVALPWSLKVYGFNTQTAAFALDGGEQTYKSFFPGVTSAQLIKAAGLSLGKDKKSFGRATKGGVLTVDTEAGMGVLRCTVVVE
jgi:hypothetical protein